MVRGKGWSRDELLLAFRLYCRTPFGRLHYRNPEIVELAKLIGRTAGSAAMKACNFASLDPAQQARGIRGLKGASQADRDDAEKVEPQMIAGLRAWEWRQIVVKPICRRY